MKYTITETVDTMPWSQGVSDAPSELVKIAKDMAERGEPATFGRVFDNVAKAARWVILTTSQDNQLVVAARAAVITPA